MFSRGTMRFLQSKKLISLFFLVIFSFYALFQSYASVSDIKYPTNEWHVSTPEEQGMQSKTLLDMMEVIKDQKYNIHSVTIVRNGSLVLDSYLYPFKNGKGHEMYSATKSVTSAIMGIAIDKGHIKDVHQPITQFFSQ
jgi:CubicO group peptidase (beta-lactamase class C family)